MLTLGLCLHQVGAQTETELKEKKLRVEDALNATKVRRLLLIVCYTPCVGCFFLEHLQGLLKWQLLTLFILVLVV